MTVILRIFSSLVMLSVRMLLKLFIFLMLWAVLMSLPTDVFALVSVSFQPNSSAINLDLKSTISQNLGTFSYYSDGALGCDITITSTNNSKLQRGSSTDRISYTLTGSTDGILLQTSAPSRTISISTSNVIDVTQIISLVSNGVMDNSGSNPFQLVAGTYTDTITVNIVAK